MLKCYIEIGTHIGMTIFWFSVVEMVHGVVALQEGYEIITDDIQRIDWWEVFM